MSKRQTVFAIAIAIMASIMTLVLIGCGAKPEIDLSNYIVIEGVSGLNGEGTVEYYFDEYLLLSDMVCEITEEEMEKMSEKELEKVFNERLEKMEEVGNVLSCITLTAAPETGLSNGDTVTVAAIFENSEEFEFSNTFKNGMQTYTVSGLKDPIIVDPLSDEHIVLKFSGFDGTGLAYLEVVGQGSNYPSFSYSMSKNANLCNGDTITVTVQYNQHQLERLGYRIPTVTERTFTVSGLFEYYDISNGILDEDLAALCDYAYAEALKMEENEINGGAEILSNTQLVAAYFLEVSEPGTTYRDFWYGIDMTNSVVVVTTYTLKYTGMFGFTRTYWTLWLFPDCYATEDGHLAYHTNEFESYSSWQDTAEGDFESFYEWFAEEFNTMEITNLELPG